MSNMRETHYVLVAISWPIPVSTELAAELVEQALDQANETDALCTCHGNGPNPPYLVKAESIYAFPDERP